MGRTPARRAALGQSSGGKQVVVDTCNSCGVKDLEVADVRLIDYFGAIRSGPAHTGGLLLDEEQGMAKLGNRIQALDVPHYCTEGRNSRPGMMFDTQEQTSAVAEGLYASCLSVARCARTLQRRSHDHTLAWSEPRSWLHDSE